MIRFIVIADLKIHLNLTSANIPQVSTTVLSRVVVIGPSRNNL